MTPTNHDEGPELQLQRTFSGDTGGCFGGDGGVLTEPTAHEGWCERTDTRDRRQREQRETEVDMEKQDAESVKTTSSDQEDEWEVRWEENDPENPRNLVKWRKWLCTYVVSSASLCVTCASSIYTSTYFQTEKEYGISKMLAISGLSLFVMGLGIGPMILAPLSEFYGRRPIYLASFSCFTLLLLPCALAPNITVLLIFRFFTGMAGSAFLSVAGGTVGDMFSGRELGAPMMIYTASPFVGPELGPLIGGFINQNANWRWTFWVMMIWSFFEFAAIYFFVPETYNPVLLRRRAVSLRQKSGDDRHYAPIERLNRSIPRTIAWSCLRPFQLLTFEPMLLMLCIFTAILLGVLYLFFQAFPLVFSGVHGFDVQTTGLTFLGLFIGMVSGILSDPFWARMQAKLTARNNGVHEPEFRLLSGVLGGILVPIGIFWFSWTTFPSIHWIVPIIASVFFGVGTLLVFSAVFTFLVEAYPLYAASALAANSFVRSCFAAGFPLFSGVLYQKLGNQWAGSVLGFLCLVMAPTMAAFMVWGKKIRANSRFAGGRK